MSPPKPSSTITPYLLLLITTLLTHPASSNYISHDCANSTTFSPDSAYRANLDALLKSLLLGTSARNGVNDFYYASAGRRPPDVVFGLFLCRGDAASEPACAQCVTDASADLLRRCPAEKQAVIWYDLCLLRYSDQPIFAFPSLTPAKFLPGARDSSADDGKGDDQFELLLDSMVGAMAAKAANAEPRRKFAAAKENLTGSETVFGLAQCTPDLTVGDCSKCFMSAKDSIRSCCSGRRSAKLLLPSCYVMYDVVLFFNATALETPPLPPQGKSTRTGKTKSHVLVATVVPVFGILILVSSAYSLLRWKARKKYNAVITQDRSGDDTSVESLQYNFRSIQIATSKFSDNNMLGKGGFGEVYKGTLLGGRDIAVKRLSKSSGQGSAEFKNEVVLLAKLQHRNLVRLLGFCLEGEEKLLIYEYVSNKSLDYFLFDPDKQGQLNWSTRRSIIEGIARGVVYLHEDSRLKIIHRDLKASNILLDSKMNPKVSDFGLAKMFGTDQTQENTMRIVGTYGYMAPEYAMEGQYSTKSDVYSFGVLLLEILSGRKNTSFHMSDYAPSLVAYAWRLWNEKKAIDLMDPCLKDSCHPSEFQRFVQIGLLCVQEGASMRPTMSSVVLMMKSEAQNISQPERPAFIASQPCNNNLEIVPANSCSVNAVTVSDFFPR